ncbi:MAG: hypothetical protein WB816_02020 [Methylocystis sp.]
MIRRANESRERASRSEPTDAAIDAAVASDPDWADIELIDWSTAEVVVPPRKQAISIRLDEDLIGFFRVFSSEVGTGLREENTIKQGV